MSWFPIAAGASRALFPSLGFFGPSDADALTIDVSERIRFLRIRVEDGASAVLDLKGLALFRDGKTIALAPDSYRTTLSSVANERIEPDGSAMLARGIVTSAQEAGPTWTIAFEKAERVDSIRIYNRPDALSFRSLSLVVSCERASGEERVLYDARSHDLLAFHLFESARLAGSLEFTDASSDPASLRLAWTTRIAARLLDRTLALDASDANVVLAMVPFFEPAALRDDDMVLLAAVLHARRRANRELPLRVLGRCLRSRSDLDTLTDSLARVALASSEPGFVPRRGVLVAADTLDRATPDRFADWPWKLAP